MIKYSVKLRCTVPRFYFFIALRLDELLYVIILDISFNEHILICHRLFLVHRQQFQNNSVHTSQFYTFNIRGIMACSQFDYTVVSVSFYSFVHTCLQNLVPVINCSNDCLRGNAFGNLCILQQFSFIRRLHFFS